MKQQRKELLDEIERVYVATIDNERFRALRAAVFAEQTVEGSLLADDLIAAKIIRERANEMLCSAVSTAKLHDIMIGLRAVERRFHISRNQRRP